MLRTLRQVRLAMSARSLAAIALSLAVVSVVTAGGSARAAGACPDPFVEATVNIDGAVGPGCRAIFTPYEADGSLAGERYLTMPPGTGDLSARVLVVGGGASGSTVNMVGTLDGGSPPLPVNPTLGGGGGGGGGVAQRELKLKTCRKYPVAVGRGGTADLVHQDWQAVDQGKGWNQKPGFYSQFGNGPFQVYGDNGDKGVVDSWAFPLGSIDPSDQYQAWGGGYSGTGFPAQAGGVSSLGGGGGGAGKDPGGDASPNVAYPPVTGIGGNGGAGEDFSALFPGLAGANSLGAGGGGFGITAGGTAPTNAGSGGTFTASAGSGVHGTGGGGGGGAQAGPKGSAVLWSAGDGGDGIVVVDIRVPDASASCTFVPKAPGGSKPASGSAASGSGSAAIKASPKVSVTQVPAGGTVTVTLSARNAGTTAAKKARIVFPAPVGFAIVRAPGAKVANGRVATWSVGTLKPRATVKRTVVLQASADAIGRKRIRFSVVSSLGTTHAKAGSVWVTGPSSVTG